MYWLEWTGWFENKNGQSKKFTLQQEVYTQEEGKFIVAREITTLNSQGWVLISGRSTTKLVKSKEKA